MSNYSDKLKSPKWQKKRLEILQRDNFTCCNCGDTERTLHVHHESYIKGKEPWDYPNKNFTTLCDMCHENNHLLKTEFEKFAYKLLFSTEMRALPKICIDIKELANTLLKEEIDISGNLLKY